MTKGPIGEQNSSPNELPSYQEVTDAYAQIVEHNKRHTGFGSIAGAIARAIIKSDSREAVGDDRSHDNASDPVEEELKTTKVEGDMSGEIQEIIHQAIFKSVGLKLVSLGSEWIASSGVDATSAKIDFEIEDIELFSKFLGTIDPEDVVIGPNQLIPSILTNLQRRISWAYSNNVPEDQQAVSEKYGEEALRSFLTIEPDIERLRLDSESLRERFPQKPKGRGWLRLGAGASDENKVEKAAHDEYDNAMEIAENYDLLQQYVEYWGRDLLPEFIESGLYLVEPAKQEFGPSQWHIDGGEHYWRHALDCVDRYESDDRTKSYGEEVKASLIRSLDSAIKDLQSGSESAGWKLDVVKDLDNIRKLLKGDKDCDRQRIIEYTRNRWEE